MKYVIKMIAELHSNPQGLTRLRSVKQDRAGPFCHTVPPNYQLSLSCDLFNFLSSLSACSVLCIMDSIVVKKHSIGRLYSWSRYANQNAYIKLFRL